MTDTKWRSPTGASIANHETDHIPDGGRMVSKTMNDLKTVRDEILEADLNCKQVIIDILDRMIETPAPQGWSAIETAPKDGTEILLALWSGHPEHKTSFCWAINGHHKDGFFYSKDPMIGKLASPTHWQPITAPTPAPTEIDLEGLKRLLYPSIPRTYEDAIACATIDHLAAKYDFVRKV